MSHRIFTVVINEHIYVRQNHSPFSKRANNVAALFKSTPGERPWPPMVVKRNSACARATGGMGDQRFIQWNRR